MKEPEKTSLRRSTPKVQTKKGRQKKSIKTSVTIKMTTWDALSKEAAVLGDSDTGHVSKVLDRYIEQGDVLAAMHDELTKLTEAFAAGPEDTVGALENVAEAVDSLSKTVAEQGEFMNALPQIIEQLTAGFADVTTQIKDLIGGAEIIDIRSSKVSTG